MPPMIDVKKLEKRYGDFIAVKGISFSVEPGQLFGFLGPNGAGKTTTISMLTTLLKPTGGEAFVAGYNISTQANDVRHKIGVIFQDPSLDTELTAYENLFFHGVLYNLPTAKLQALIPDLLNMVGLSEFSYKQVKTFSGGMKRRLEIARGLIHRPSVLFLDEPTLGLDAQTRETIWQYINQIRKETTMTIFLTTHYLEETERCDKIAIIDHGEIIALDSPENLKKTYKKSTVEAVFLELTGRDIRDAQISALEQSREKHRQGAGGRFQ